MTHSAPLFVVKVDAKLTVRQAYALKVLVEAGHAGVAPIAFGAEVHAWQDYHPATDRCDFCKSAGLELLKALRKKGVARQRRVDGRTFWQATDLSVTPLGDLPEGF